MGTGHDVVRHAVALDRLGGRYVWGAKGPKHFDCSGFSYAAARKAGGNLVHGSRPQRDQLLRAGRLVSVATAMRTPGALLFRIGVTATDHVSISLGNGSVIEAHSSKHGIGVFSAQGRRWTHGGLIPGVNYNAVPAPPKPAPGAVDWPALIAAVKRAKTMVFRLGNKDEHIKLLQTGINNLSKRGLVVDGHYGPATQQAVLDLQRWFGLKVDGVAGPQVWNLLYPHV